MGEETADATRVETQGRWLAKFFAVHSVVLLPALLLSIERPVLFFALAIAITAVSIAAALRNAGPKIGLVAKTYCAGLLIFTGFVAAMAIYAIDQRKRCQSGELDCTCVPSEDLVQFDQFGQMKRFEGNNCAP